MSKSTELSTKAYVLVLTDGARFFLDEKDSDTVKKALLENKKWLEIGGSVINTFNVSRLVSGADYEEAERTKRGDYRCPSCKEWMPKGLRCGYCV